jgi:ribosome biogenesis GTPase
VRRVDAHAVEVAPDDGSAPVACRLRGRLHRFSHGERSPLAPGDRVEVEARADSEPVVVRVHPRRSRFARESATGGKAQVVAANVDLVVAILAAAEPPPSPRLSDRILTAAAAEGVAAAVVVTKADIAAPGVAEDLAALYRAARVPVVAVATPEGRGVEEVAELLRGRTSVLVGPSGAGKSTLLRALLGDVASSVRTGLVNARTGKGRHTTTAAALLPFPGGGWIVDTPGVRTLALPRMRPAELAGLFPDLRDHGACRFQDCTHRTEPACAVARAAEEGRADPRRLESYRAMLVTMLEDEARRGPVSRKRRTGGRPPEPEERRDGRTSPAR